MLLDISSALNLSFVHMPVCWKFIMIEIIYHTWDLSWLTKILLLQKSPWTIVSNFEDESFWFLGEALFQRALKSDFLNLCNALIISSGFPMIIICFSSDLKVLNQSFASRSFICKLHKPKIHEIKSAWFFSIIRILQVTQKQTSYINSYELSIYFHLSNKQYFWKWTNANPMKFFSRDLRHHCFQVVN